MLDQGVAVIQWQLPEHLQLIATRPVQAGERVFQESPLLWVKEGGNRHPAWELTEGLLLERPSRLEYLAWNLRRIALPA